MTRKQKVEKFIKKALAYQTLTAYADMAMDLDKLDEDWEKVDAALKATKPKSAEEAGALAILRYVNKIPKE